MTKRLRLIAPFALTLLAPSIGLAQLPGAITVEFYNAPLSQVIRGFAAYSGSTIIVARDAGDPSVTASLRDVDWRLGLDRILAPHALIAWSDPSGIIRVEKRHPVITVEFENAPLSQVIRAFTAFSGSTVVVAPDAGDPVVTATMTNTDWRLALDRILEAHALVARLDSTGIIRIERRAPPPIRPPGDARSEHR